MFERLFLQLNPQTNRVYIGIRPNILSNFSPIRLNDKPQSTPKIRTQMAPTHTLPHITPTHTLVRQGNEVEGTASCFRPPKPSDPSVAGNSPWSYMRAYQHAADFRCYSRGACLPNTAPPP